MKIPSQAWLLAAVCACTSQTLIGVVDDNASAGAGAGAGVGGSALAGAGSAAIGGAALGGEQGAVEPQFPYPATRYAEPFRGQFHFSAASGWMNDIDGLWYANGAFHVAYQASPRSFQGGQDLHWGHATSADLLHWEQQALLLVPGQNVEGEAWSGSVVVDTDNTSGFGSAATPPIIALYTDTALGTSLAYSSDAGATWQAYDQNPLGIGNASYESNRDPAVVWHAPSKRWVCAFWENGTTFYTSPDLKAWTKASNIAFGGVMSDLYELPLDDDVTDPRWVLQNADGAYLVGQFDGRTFVPEGVPLELDLGPSFFAGRTFFRGTFPDARVVQMAWMKPSAQPTAPFRGSATFPVELRLETLPSGVRVTRTPITELASLYGAQKHWDAQSVPSGKNLLAGMRSKTFDLELALDVAQSNASKLTFRIANKTFSYDLTEQSLFGARLAPSGGKVTLRVLVDWGQLEVFGNGGELSYTESVAFTPEDASLSLTADGAWRLISAELREVGRSWPGVAERDARILDDAEPDVLYAGAWNTVTDDATFFGDTCHYSTAAGARLETTFTGTRLDWYGLRNTDLGKADIFVDDALVAEALDCYGPLRGPAQLFSVSGLPNTFHTVRIVARGDQQAASTGSALVHDYFVTSVED